MIYDLYTFEFKSICFYRFFLNYTPSGQNKTNAYEGLANKQIDLTGVRLINLNNRADDPKLN
ncbi:hypothetical protein BpHYR1_045474 [Brachionus plicatilis]|uniref:Uncharacterized protein n=1 Tax=Brachionus plicatilis TaxID=10195 RepID=A0A3M7QF07_BRAPC|nr:hypothetical protein BpHYR1_045474 [Brachionus plicatilis]